MTTAQLRIITPSKVALEQEVRQITIPTVDGEITVLPRHEKYFTMLKEGIITILGSDGEDDYLAIGGGYMETDGKTITVLVSRAYGQDEIDEKMVDKAKSNAEKILEETKDMQEKAQALAAIRRSEIDFKLLKKRKKYRSTPSEN